MVQDLEVRHDLIQTLLELEQCAETIKEICLLLQTEEEMWMMLTYVTLLHIKGSDNQYNSEFLTDSAKYFHKVCKEHNKAKGIDV